MSIAEMVEHAYEIAKIIHSFDEYSYHFINELTNQPNSLTVTGIKLAASKNRDKDMDIYECILMLDNCQFFYYRENTKNRTGKYIITDNLDDIESYHPKEGLISKALYTIRGYYY